ncbi:MAG: hypothetical protein A2287_06770 [Candidatus Melainabacteria bacterium RIFOXYA12_FULL_32_12]|nr:MAG: hypothetical protein A2255_01525 [Candidatus Melainabacteria bacterium RIFOXYA2_FULL_32_9]OGI25817.1 MAG: hypothetical protein A2287_06770 [Candidatus Melainabacteria bacterium RIFOXYA12_FULL_32_12]
MNEHRQNKKGFCSIAIILFLAFVLAGIASGLLYLNNLPPISELQNYQPTLASQIVSSDGVVIKTFGSYKYKKVQIRQIPDNLKKAIIATEDKNFYIHKGFDPIALIRSTISNLMARRVVQGASTITQQLARILFLSTEKTMDRKIKELIIAYRLEKTLPKDEILEMYLNNVYLGEGAYGVSAAAEIYFNKKIEDLTLPEAALIAGLPQAPSAYSPYQSMEKAKARRAMVLERMFKMGCITEEEAEKANKAPIKINKSHRPYALNKAPYFVDLVMKELRDKAGLTEEEIIHGGYKIYTTLKYKYQSVADERVGENMSRWGLKKPYQQVALLSFDVVTGRILAYIGGKDYYSSQFDRVSLAVRQPGSSFKVFVYAAAIERGLNPKSIYTDAPVSIGNWSPRNYAGRYRGRIPLYQALAYSSNSIAARLIKEVGVDSVISMARRLGINTYLAHDPTIALGSNGVKLIEMSTAYGALANGGVKVEPYGVERVETPNGRTIYQAGSNYKRVLDTKTAAYMVEMMEQVVKMGTGRAANIDRPAAGKTGTTDSYKDAWFIGFTPNVVTGIWIGNDNNTSNHGVTGGTVPAIIWGQYMRVVEANNPIMGFLYPEITINDKDKLNAKSLENDDIVNEEGLSANETSTQETPKETEIMQQTESSNKQNNQPPIPKPLNAPVPEPEYTPPVPPLPDHHAPAGNAGF